MTNLITNNPFRILGVFSNSSKKDVLSNLNKMKAFMKVGKSMSFPMDLQSILPPIGRNEQMIAEAQSAIERPIDQLKHSLFWFNKSTQFDEIAINHLTAGNLSQAKEIWSKSENASSLVNLLVCALIENDYTGIAKYADKLFQGYSAELTSTVSDTLRLSPLELTELFVETLSSDGLLDVAKLAFIPGTSNIWQSTLSKGLVKPIIDKISNAIAEAKKSKGSRPNYDAGVKLMNSTMGDLQQLKGILSTSNMEYQMIADKLAQAILQCGINYFNESDDDDAPQKAMTLQNYALSIAVGQLAKQRCQENVNVLKNMGPEYAIRKEMDAIGRLLKTFNALSKRSASTILERYSSYSPLGTQKSRYTEHDILNLVNQAKPELNKIKSKLGVSNELYLKISSAVASAAINALIDIVNKEQEAMSMCGGNAALMLSPTISSAVETMSIIGRLDMTSQCRTYFNNNSTLNSINRQLQPKQTSSGGCYIATMVYGDYDHPQVMALRNFRDEFLDHREWGRRFIRFYYKHSPGWVEKLKSHKLINKGIQKILDSFIFVWKKISQYE